MPKKQAKVEIQPIEAIDLAINEIHFIKNINDPRTNKYGTIDVYLKSDEKIDKLVKILKDLLK